MSGKTLGLACTTLIASVIGGYLVAPYLHLERGLLPLVAIAGHALALGTKRYGEAKRQKTLSELFANYRCPRCRYFVPRETRLCPKCRNAIIPQVD